MLEHPVTYAIAAFLSRSFPLPFSYWIGLRIADAFYRSDARGRRAVESNLRRILAHRGVEPAGDSVGGLVRKTYQHFGKYIVDFFRYSCANHEELDGKVSIEHMEHLLGALAEKRGVLAVTAHLGNWEMGGLMLSLLGHPVNAVYRPLGARRLDRVFADQRERRGVKLIPLGRAVRGVLAALRRGEIAAVLADRNFTENGGATPFFGAPARLPLGAAMLSLRTGAPIVPAFMIRQVDDRFLMRFHPPIRPEEEKTVEAIEAKIVAALEDSIGENPCQWFVFEDFWAAGAGAAPAAEGRP